MIHFLFRMVRNQAVAEELAQEVFLRVYRSRESYRAEAKFTTWLYRIATNLAVNHARDTRHERAAQTLYLDAPDEETGATPDVADDEPTVEQRLLRNERMAAIRTHVMALPERQRMAVLMHSIRDGLSADRGGTEIERVCDQVAALPRLPDAARYIEGICVSGNKPGDTGGSGDNMERMKTIAPEWTRSWRTCCWIRRCACQGSSSFCGV